MTVAELAASRAGPPPPAAWALPVLEGHRDAWNAPRGERTLGRVRFAEWLRR